MGRIGKLKKKSTSVHSRAARRETSPSADVDKSIKSMPRLEAPSKPSSVLAAHAYSGISKKKSKTKPLSRAQRLRQQKSIARAESVMDQLENKVAKSTGRAKVVNARKAQWEDLNTKHNTAVKILEAQGSDDERMESEQHTGNITNQTQSIPSSAADNDIPPNDHVIADEDDEIT